MFAMRTTPVRGEPCYDTTNGIFCQVFFLFFSLFFEIWRLAQFHYDIPYDILMQNSNDPYKITLSLRKSPV